MITPLPLFYRFSLLAKPSLLHLLHTIFHHQSANNHTYNCQASFSSMADAVPKESISLDNNANPSKFFTQFLYKAALVTLFLVLLPLFPSLAPDFINQTLHARSWELLQLIFVGIAVSYGLFSKKNDEKDKDHNSANAQSYVAKLLQVSSVFDDESEIQTVIEENKFQALNSQYSRGQPIVAKETPVVEDENGVVSRISQKPLLLPVRSLKQRVPSPNLEDLPVPESAGENVSRSGSRRFSNSNSRKFRAGDLGGLNVQKLEETVEENVVLRSPIPWRSRSGRMEIRENGDDSPRVTGSGSLMEEQEFKSLEKPRSFKSPAANSSPKKLSTKSPTFSAESQAKTIEDSVRKKGFSSPPPAPPPPPPHFLRKSVLTKSNSSAGKNAHSPEKVFRRSVRSVPEAELPRRTSPGLGSEFVDRVQTDGSVKSVRTFRPSEVVTTAEKESDDYSPTNNEILEKVLMESTDDEDSEAEEEDDDQFEVGSGGKGEAAADVGPDVDKKADEFIAKFREQIRLQRIESIRKTTAQRAGKSLR